MVAPPARTPATPLRTITIDVQALARQALKVQSFHARGEAPYLDAHDELRAETAIAAGFSGQLPPQPLQRAALTIICYVGRRRYDGYYRPRRAHMLHYILEPFYAALIDGRIIVNMGSVDSIRVMLRRNEREGFRVHLRELAPGGIDDDYEEAEG